MGVATSHALEEQAWSKVVQDSSSRLRGAAMEIGDVHDSLGRVEQVESRVERDMHELLTAFGKNETPLAKVLSSEDANLAMALGQHLSNMRQDLASLVTMINATRNELFEAREAVATTETALADAKATEIHAKVAERLRHGKATVDYETGQVASLLAPGERRRIGWVVGADNISKIEAQLLEQTKRGHMSRRVIKETYRVDPALLHLDTRFLQDMVVLSLSTALGGLGAAAVGAPYTLGNMVSGVVIGPSCLDLVRNLEQAETLAQFGSIFLLFSHGLMYSRYYGKEVEANSEEKDGEEEIDDEADDAEEADDVEITSEHHAFASGFALVIGLGLAFAAAARVVGVAGTAVEAAFYSAALSLSSSSTVLATLRDARLDDTLFGKTVVELLSVQDLVLAPLLALPTAVSEMITRRTKTPLVSLIAFYAVVLALVVVLARRLLPRALGALGGGLDTVKGKRWARDTPSVVLHASDDANRRRKSVGAPSKPFQQPRTSRLDRQTAKQASLSLCVVGYALAMALLADRLNLSHEAGALFAGLVLVGTPHVDKAQRAVEPLTSLFGGMYVASLGLVASPRYLKAHAVPLLGRVSAVLLVKLVVVAPVVYSLGFSRLAGLGAGLVFGHVSEVALFVAARAHRLHLVERATYLDVLSSTVVLLAIAPLAVHLVRRIDKKHFKALEAPSDNRNCIPLLARFLKLPWHLAKCLVFQARDLAFLKKR